MRLPILYTPNILAGANDRLAGPAPSLPCVTPLVAALALCVCVPASAATITVDSTSGDSVAGACSLRDAVISANTHAAAPASSCSAGDGNNDTLVFAPAVTDIVFSAPASGQFSALVVSETLTITGSAVATNVPVVTIERSSASGTPNFGLIESNSDLTLRNLTLRNGQAVSGRNGGAISMTALSTLTVSGSMVSGNHSSSGGGGAIYGGTVNISDSIVRGNSAGGPTSCFGGGIAASTATLINSIVSDNAVVCSGTTAGGGIYAAGVSLTSSTVSGNSANSTGFATYAYGGGIDGQTVHLTNSTVSGNSSFGPVALGGGVFAFTGYLTNATISRNSSSGSGGGMYVGRGPVSSGIQLNYCTLTGNTVPSSKVGAGLALGNGASAASDGTLLYGNTGGSDIDVASGVVTLGGHYNLIGSHGSNVTVPADTKSCNPMLGPLGDNGGSTKTHGLFNGSCAIDAAGASPVTISGGIPITTDERGTGYARVKGIAADIGAFEKQGLDDPDLIFADGFEP